MRSILWITTFLLMFYPRMDLLSIEQFRPKMKLIIGSQFNSLNSNNLKQFSLHSYFTLFPEDSPEHRFRISEITIGTKSPIQWHGTVLSAENSREEGILKIGNSDISQECFSRNNSNIYEKFKIVLVDIGYDNPLIREFRWINFSYGKGLTSQIDSYNYDIGNDFHKPIVICVYGDAILGLGIGSFIPDSSLSHNSINSFYTGLETNTEAQVTIRYLGYFGIYLQPYIKMRYTISKRSLGSINEGIRCTFLYKNFELFSSYERIQVIFSDNNESTNHFQFGLSYKVTLSSTKRWN